MPINNQGAAKYGGMLYPYGQQMNPYGGFQSQQSNFLRPQTNETHLPRVKGLQGAQEYPISFNSQIALFDEDTDVFYLKEADANGYTRLTVYEYKEQIVEDQNTPQYVKLEDFEQFKKEVLDGQQRIQEAISKSNSKPAYEPTELSNYIIGNSVSSSASR